MSTDYKKLDALSKAIYLEEFSEIQKIFVEDHIRLLCSLRAIFGNDLDKIIILALIGQRWFHFGLPEAHSYELTDESKEKYRDDTYVNSNGLINIESISSSTGIPRESVRRKVRELEKDGIITTRARGRLWVDRTAMSILDESSKLIGNMIAHTFVDMTKRLEKKSKINLDILEDETCRTETESQSTHTGTLEG